MASYSPPCSYLLSNESHRQHICNTVIKAATAGSVSNRQCARRVFYGDPSVPPLKDEFPLLQLYRVTGNAGSGKTEIIADIVNSIPGAITCASTSSAYNNLWERITQSIPPNTMNAAKGGTADSLFYDILSEKREPTDAEYATFDAVCERHMTEYPTGDNILDTQTCSRHLRELYEVVRPCVDDFIMRFGRKMFYNKAGQRLAFLCNDRDANPDMFERAGAGWAHCQNEILHELTSTPLNQTSMRAQSLLATLSMAENQEGFIHAINMHNYAHDLQGVSKLLTSPFIIGDEFGRMTFFTILKHVAIWYIVHDLFNTPAINNSVPCFILFGSTKQSAPIGAAVTSALMYWTPHLCVNPLLNGRTDCYTNRRLLSDAAAMHSGHKKGQEKDQYVHNQEITSAALSEVRNLTKPDGLYIINTALENHSPLSKDIEDIMADHVLSEDDWFNPSVLPDAVRLTHKHANIVKFQRRQQLHYPERMRHTSEYIFVESTIQNKSAPILIDPHPTDIQTPLEMFLQYAAKLKKDATVKAIGNGDMPENTAESPSEYREKLWAKAREWNKNYISGPTSSMVDKVQQARHSDHAASIAEELASLIAATDPSKQQERSGQQKKLHNINLTSCSQTQHNCYTSFVHETSYSVEVDGCGELTHTQSCKTKTDVIDRHPPPSKRPKIGPLASHQPLLRTYHAIKGTRVVLAGSNVGLSARCRLLVNGFRGSFKEFVQHVEDASTNFHMPSTYIVKIAIAFASDHIENCRTSQICYENILEWRKSFANIFITNRQQGYGTAQANGKGEGQDEEGDYEGNTVRKTLDTQVQSTASSPQNVQTEVNRNTLSHCKGAEDGLLLLWGAIVNTLCNDNTFDQEAVRTVQIVRDTPSENFYCMGKVVEQGGSCILLNVTPFLPRLNTGRMSHPYYVLGAGHTMSKIHRLYIEGLIDATLYNRNTALKDVTVMQLLADDHFICETVPQFSSMDWKSLFDPGKFAFLPPGETTNKPSCYAPMHASSDDESETNSWESESPSELRAERPYDKYIEQTALISSAHEVYDAYACTVSFAQGYTLRGKVFIHVESINDMSHMLVAATRATKPSNVYLTSNNFQHITKKGKDACLSNIAADKLNTSTYVLV